MKIAMIGHKRVPSRSGGVEVVVEELSVRMARMGYDVDVYNRGDVADRATVYNGVRLVVIPRILFGALSSYAHMLLATLRAIAAGYDVVHYHAEGACSMLFITRLFHVRTVATIHGLDWQRAKWGRAARLYLRLSEAMSAKYADEIIVLSQNARRYFWDKYSRDTHYIPNGVTCPPLKDSSCLERKFALKKNGYILFLARIVPEKGLHYLLDAFESLSPTLSLVVAGEYCDAKYAKKINQRVKNAKNIIMTGFVEGELMEELYSNAYVYVLPSDVEGMPMSLLEAMSYGKCCLVSDIPEHMEIITDENGKRHAVTFARGDAESLARELKRLIEDAGIVTDVEKRCRQYVCERFQWDGSVKKTIEIYEHTVC